MRQQSGNFTYIKPTNDQVEDIHQIRESCEQLHRELLEVLPSNREAALAITKLEEVSMWANKSIVLGE